MGLTIFVLAICVLAFSPFILAAAGWIIMIVLEIVSEFWPFLLLIGIIWLCVEGINWLF